MSLDETTVNDWLGRYVEAWRSYAPDQIRGLFTNYATYQYQPWGDELKGADAIVADWLKEPDEAGSWEAAYRCDLVSGERAIAVGRTAYADGNVYANLFQLRFESGRCSGFVEWYMTETAGVVTPPVVAAH